MLVEGGYRSMSELARKTRRLATRRDADWAARCCFAPAEDWIDGRVVNASMSGVALQVSNGAPQTGSVTIDMRPTRRARLRVRGDIRHAQTVGDRMILGIEFTALTPDESAALAKMLEKYTSA